MTILIITVYNYKHGNNSVSQLRPVGFYNTDIILVNNHALLQAFVAV